MVSQTEQKSPAWTHKVNLGIHVLPEAWRVFQRIALAQHKSTSVLLGWVIENAWNTGFKIYDVAPKYGEISDATTLTMVNLLPEHKSILQEWAKRENCAITKIVRALIDHTVQNYKGQLPDDMEGDEAPLFFFQWCIDFNLPIEKIVNDLLKDFAKADVHELLKGYVGSGENLIDGEFDFSDEQAEILKQMAANSNLTFETIKLAFVLYVRQVANQPIFRNCYVPKEVHSRYKDACTKVFTTVSMMLNSHVSPFAQRNFQRLQENYSSEDEEFQRINFNMTWRTKLILESVCERNQVKMSEAIRLLMYASCEIVSKFDVERIREDIMLKHVIMQSS